MRDSGITRRRAIRIVAAAAGLPLLIAGVRATAPPARAFHWHGEVLGAAATLTLWHADEALARRTILKARAEIDRYERIFSLYRHDSEISRLNRDAVLLQPAPELRLLIEESQRLGALSGGAFDISVQPLWRLYEAHFWSRSKVEPDLVTRAQEVARALVDFRRIEVGRRIALARPGMGVTLNGIAQGFVTDCIADLVRNEGFDSAVVDLGEVRALGSHPAGRPWQLGIEGADRDGLAGTVALADMALAVSGGHGTTFEPSGRFHHIFDPASGSSADRLRDVAVLAPRAMTADGLSTAIAVMGAQRAPLLLAAFPGTRAIVTRPDGTRETITTRSPA